MLIHRARATCRANIVKTASSMPVEVEFSIHPSQPANIDDVPVDRGGLHILVDELTRQHIDGDIDTVTVRRLENLFEPSVVAGIK